MKRFLLFHQTDSCTMGATAAGAYIGDFDRVEDVLADIPKLQKTTGVNNDIYLDILDTRDQTWHEHYFPAFSEDYSGGRLAKHFQDSLEEIRTMFDTSLVPMRRYQLHHTVAHESLFGMSGLVGTWEDIAGVLSFLNNLDLTHTAVYDGRNIDLSSADQLTLVDTATTRSQTVDYADESTHPTSYSREYLDFAQFDQLSEPNFVD